MRYCATLPIICLITSIASAADVPRRQILICTSSSASPAVKKLADDVVARANTIPVLKGLIETQDAGPVVRVSSEDLLNPKEYLRAAYNHLVVIGLPGNDALLAKVWEHYATVDDKKHTIYAQGWGELKGDIGYVESDRNPFLHSRKLKEAPFETILFKISGTSEAGIAAAANAFSTGLLNGLVPIGSFERPRRTILDLDPVVGPPPLHLPQAFPLGKAGSAGPAAVLVGWSQAPANEYRAYIDVAGYEPTGVWRCKYLVPHALDRTGTAGWMAGFHRMAYGNAVTIAQFKTAEQATATAAKIGMGAGWKKVKSIEGHDAWEAAQPTDEAMPESLGQVTVLARGSLLILSSLSGPATAAVLEHSN